MPTQRPFLSNFLAAFRAHSQPLPKTSPTSTAAATYWTSAAPRSTSPAAAAPADTQPAVTSPRPIINPKSGAPYAQPAQASAQQAQERPQLQHIVSPATHLPRSPSASPPVYGPPNKPSPSYPTVQEARSRRSRRGSGSSSDSGGFREVRGAGEKWFIGGRTAGGEERYYALAMVRRERSADRISADRLSL